MTTRQTLDALGAARELLRAEDEFPAEMSAEDVARHELKRAEVMAQIERATIATQTREADQADQDLYNSFDPDDARQLHDKSTSAVDNMLREIYESNKPARIMFLPGGVAAKPSPTDYPRSCTSVNKPKQAFANGQARADYYVQNLTQLPRDGGFDGLSIGNMTFSFDDNPDHDRIMRAADPRALRLQNAVTTGGTSNFPALTEFSGMLDQARGYVGGMMHPSKINLKVRPFNTSTYQATVINTEAAVDDTGTDTDQKTGITDPGLDPVEIRPRAVKWVGSVSKEAEYNTYVDELTEQIGLSGGIGMMRQGDKSLTIGDGTGTNKKGILTAVKALSGNKFTFPKDTSSTFQGDFGDLWAAWHELDSGIYWGSKMAWFGNRKLFGKFAKKLFDDNPGAVNGMYPAIDMKSHNPDMGVLYDIWTMAAWDAPAMGTDTEAGDDAMIFGNFQSWCTIEVPAIFELNPWTHADQFSWLITGIMWVNGDITWSQQVPSLHLLQATT